ncbi:MBL fold metallo-hydrolase RNA specificity domain-containing protein [Baileyella intestinalis]|uniref:MBL fold metallo-hydrolase RNA specificity domain-containing protein n=1 Tax=Baileyella intestinalis TaxID=2606709 RepID=UPI0022E2430A|nr:MBL fold metallo-hydrolase [Baileyella intestinalis]
MKIKFCGASTGVTGSCHLLSTENHNLLLDCGQFQGGKSQDKLNFEDFPFDPSKVEAMILSHAHIDHCGRIPLLVKRGFKGPIYCTRATADLLPIMLKDSGYIHEKEAEWASRKAQRKGLPPVEPLYTVEDAEACLPLVVPVRYDQIIELNQDMAICFNDAGHILGSAMTEIWVKESGKETKIIFSGDIGVEGRPILRDPTTFKKADYVIMESTYGNRLHPDNALSINGLLDAVLRTVDRGGTVVIPSFAVGRTQEMIYELNKVYDENPAMAERLKDIMVYIDSPMANAATEVFKKNVSDFDDEARAYIASGDHPLEFKNLRFTQNTEDSQRLNMDDKPKIIISASGMCEAGRIKHHLKHNLWNEKNTIVFVGYQAEGTLGRKIVEGATSVNIFGEEVMVKAEIVNLEGFSGHADRDGLTHWVSAFTNKPKIFLVHGEDQAKKDLASHLEEELGIKPVVITENSEFSLAPGHGEDAGTEKIGVIGGGAGEFESDLLSDEEIQSIRNKITSINENIDDALLSAKLMTGSRIGQDKLIRLNNIISELNASTVELRELALENPEPDTRMSPFSSDDEPQ